MRRLCVITALFVSCSAISADINYSDIFFEQSKRQFSGVAIIAKGKKIEFSYVETSKSNGKDENDRLSINSKFVIGSLSKQITAAIVLKLVDQNKLSLDYPIGRYLPELKTDWKYTVTIRNLLNHASGIVDLDKELEFSPGHQFKYRNINYNLLGNIVSHITKKSYSLLAQEVFDFCGMKESYSSTGSVPKDDRVNGYIEIAPHNYKQVEHPIALEALPSAGIVSTAPDLVLWTQCLHKGNLISAKMHDEMVKPAQKREHRWGELGYGFGTQIYQQGNVLEWSHSGYIPGFISTLSYYPKQDITMVLLENISWDVKDIKRVYYYHDKLRHGLISKELTNLNSR